MPAHQFDQYIKRHAKLWDKFHQQVSEIKKDYSWKRDVLHAALTMNPEPDRVVEIIKQLYHYDLAETQAIDKIKVQHSFDLGAHRAKLIGERMFKLVELIPGMENQKVKQKAGEVKTHKEKPADKPPAKRVTPSADNPTKPSLKEPAGKQPGAKKPTAKEPADRQPAAQPVSSTDNYDLLLQSAAAAPVSDQKVPSILGTGNPTGILSSTSFIPSWPLYTSANPIAQAAPVYQPTFSYTFSTETFSSSSGTYGKRKADDKQKEAPAKKAATDKPNCDRFELLVEECDEDISGFTL
ncbi:hypothetical protein A1Q2_07126 [Trichosporon asahii var. asahii CBS 8904]|uniref:Uncharacterized protein n=1 Tax=Trichosporon asahii var. asahii (strain CBS 8904) TaxID=1220162 RepID=K1VCK9_TRIAC|nr:hypothetical protein A1Q2_07126 [Trichosporon asahii var. asahii CBS 8904]